MEQTTITFQTNTLVKRQAEAIFKKQGISLESAINTYLMDVTSPVSEWPVLLYEVSDNDLTEDDCKEIAYTEALPAEEFIVYTKDGYSHT